MTFMQKTTKNEIIPKSQTQNLLALLFQIIIPRQPIVSIAFPTYPNFMHTSGGRDNSWSYS